MEEEGFTIVRRTGRGRTSRSANKAGKAKQSPQISYNSRAPAESTRRDLTWEEKLDKVLAILDTRKRQLKDQSGTGGKGKDKSFMDSWTGKHVCVCSR
jgi:hypothetical protein